MEHRSWIARGRVWSWSCVLLALNATSRAGNTNGVPVCTAPGAQILFAEAPHPSSVAVGALAVVWLDPLDRPEGGRLFASLVAPSVAGGVRPASGMAVTDLLSSMRWGLVAVMSAPAHPSGRAPTIVVYVAGPSAGMDHLRARRLFDGATAWDVDVCVADPGVAVSMPCVVRDGGAGAWVSWLDDGGEAGNRRVLVQHLRVDGTRALDGAGLVVGSGEQNHRDMRMASDGLGGVFLAWECASSLPERDSFFLQHITAAGERAPGWPASGRWVATASYGCANSKLFEDGRGGTYLVWQDWNEPTSLAARALRLLADGSRAPGWPADGLVVADRPEGDTDLRDATGDGEGGVLVAVRAGYGVDHAIVCRIGPDGRRPAGWPARGLEASTSGNDQSSPRVIGQHGGALLVWSESPPNGSADIFGARFLADGSRAPGWPVSGLVLCDAPGTQAGPVLGPADDDGAIVAWEDYRREVIGDADIYAQWVDAGGRVGVMPVAPGRLELAITGPNPVRGIARFTLELPAESRVVADVIDVAGRTLARIEDEVLRAGRHELAWDTAAPGICFLRIRTATEVRSLRFVSLR